MCNLRFCNILTLWLVVCVAYFSQAYAATETIGFTDNRITYSSNLSTDGPLLYPTIDKNPHPGQTFTFQVDGVNATQFDFVEMGVYSFTSYIDLTTGTKVVFKNSADVAIKTFDSLKDAARMTSSTDSKLADIFNSVTTVRKVAKIEFTIVTVNNQPISNVTFKNLQVDFSAAVNSTPTGTAPSAPTVTEDDTNVALADDIQVTDADGDVQTVTFTVTGGTLTTGTTGITFGGSGNGSASFTIAGTLDNINAALDAATFTPTPNLTGTNAATISFTTNDGKVSSSTASVSFDVTAVNDEPTLTATGANPTFTENGSAAVVFSSASASTVESGQTLSALTMTVTNVNDGSNERLNLDGTAIALTHGTFGTTAVNSLSYSVSVVGTTATLSLSGGTLSTSDLQTLINAITYQNNSNTPNTLDRIVTITSLTDSGGTANSGDDTAALAIASTITVNANNDVPTLTSFASVVETTTQNTEIEITLAELKAQGNEADADGTVDAFIVNALSSGSLNIGPDSGSATSFNSSTNKTIDASNNAYWTPANNAYGTLNAFTATVQDNNGAESTGAVQAVVTVNDVTKPEISSISISGSPAATETSITYVVIFTESVVNVSTDDFSLAHSGNASGSIASVSASSGTSMNVTVNGISGTGQLRLDLKASTNIADASANTSPDAYNSGAVHAVDLDNPTLSSSVPADGASGVSASDNITLTFSENIVFGTGNIQIIDLDDGSSNVMIDAASPGTQASISTNTLTLNPSGDLEEGTNYAVQLAATFIDDSNGNSYAGIVDNTILNFTVESIPTIAFNAVSSNGSEAVSSANLQVDLSAAISRDVTVAYTVTGTAEGSGTDYTLVNGILTIAAGDTSNNITIAGIVNDLLDEDNETVILTLSNPTNATLGTNTVHTYTINDNDAAPTVAFTATSSNGSEALASADLQVDLSASSGLPVTVDYTVTGTASGSGTDYTLADGTLTLAAGDVNNDITIAGIVNDLLDEDNETVIVTLSNPTNASLGTNTVHTYTINDDDESPTITIASIKPSLIAGETASLTFTLSDASPDFAVGDITVVGGSLSGFAGSGTTYTATFTPDSDRTAAATIDVAANTFIDAAGNKNTAATQLIITLDTAVPSISVASDKASLKAGETASLTFTLSEASPDFAVGDITVVGGSLSDFAGSGTSYSATFTPDTARTAAATIDVAANTFIDAAGNKNTAATQLIITLDTAVPSISVASDKASLKAGETASLTFTLSESSPDFAVGDITVVGGSLSGFAGSGTSYTATFTPDSDRTAAATIDVAANTFIDAAGNNNTAANRLSISLDTLLPGISIGSDTPSLKAGETASLTFTLSEASPDFAVGDITVVGGSLSGFAGSGSGYTATFTPDSDRTVAATIDVAANTFIDAAGNNNTAATQLSITLDTAVPTISIGSDTPSLKAGETASLTFTLSEASSDFAVGDITVVGGSLSGFAGSGTTYTATFTPDSDRTAAATIDVAANTFIDAAGNNNTAAIQLSITLDTAVPSISIASDTPSLKAGETASLIFTLSEASSDFAASDITVVGGSLGDFAGSGTGYTATFTPDSDRTAAATIDVAANAFTDSAGNTNTAATQLSITIDTAVPTISIASDKSSLKAGETAALTFTLSESSSDFAASDITVVGGSLSDFAGSGTTYTAIFTPDSDRTAAATIDVAANTFIDAAGNNNTAATQLSISLDTVLPGISIGSDTPSLKAGETAALTFTLTEGSSDFAASDITVVGGSLSGFSGSGTTYTAIFTPDTDRTAAATIDVVANAFTDSAGNNNTAATRLSISLDTVLPTISIASDTPSLKAGEIAALTFILTEASSDFAVGDITVVGGSLSGFAGSGTTYTATFTPDTDRTAAATIDVAANAFTDSAGNNNTAAIQLSITLDTLLPTISIASNKPSLKAGETASLTFTLSEASSDFAASDIIVVGGSLSGFSGSGTTYTATFTPDTDRTAAATIDVEVNAFTDSAGNNNTAAIQLSISLDTVLPTISIGSDTPSLKAGETASLTFTLSEASPDFAVGDITVVGGSLSGFAGSGTTYTATFTPDSDRTATATIDVAANAFIDAAGNNNTAATQLSITLDTAVPTISIASDKASLKAGEIAALTFILTEASSDFAVGDITVVGGSLSGFAGSGTTYTASFTPDTDRTAAATIDVAANAFTDSAGNNNTAANRLSINLDTVLPTISIGSDTPSLKAGETASLTFTLSESSPDFAVGDITVVGGSLSGFAGSGTSYTATFTPDTDRTAAATIDVAASAFIDAAGNNNTAATQLSITLDTAVPTISIGSDTPSLKAGETASLTFTLSEASPDFAVGDITVVGGSLSDFAGSGTGYSATLTPSDSGMITVDVAKGVFTDMAGNESLAADRYGIYFDGLYPYIQSLTPDDDADNVQHNASLVLVFNEAVVAGAGSVRIYDESDDSLLETIHLSGEQAVIDGATLTIDLKTLFTPTHSYYVHISADALIDTAGNAFGGIDDTSSYNFTIGNNVPVLTDDAKSVAEDNSVAIVVLDNDSDSDSVINLASVTVTTQPVHGSTKVNTGTGVVTYSPDKDFAGTDSFYYRVEDVYGGLSEAAKVTITVTAVDDDPVANADMASTDEELAVLIDVLANDTDPDQGDSADSDTLAIVSQPEHGAVAIEEGQIRYEPDANYAGSDVFTYTVRDTSDRQSNTAEVRINIAGVNDAPVTVVDSAVTNEDMPVEISVLSNDSDIDGSVDVSTVAIVSQPEKGKVVVSELGMVTYTPEVNYYGSDSFTYVVQDNEDATSEATAVSLTVNSINDAPVASDDVATLLEDSTHSINVLGNDNDIDGQLDSSSVVVFSQPEQGSVSVAESGAILFTPIINFSGEDSFTYQVRDDLGMISNIATVMFTVQPVNDAPLANDDNASTQEDNAITINVIANDSDVDGSLDTTTLKISAAPKSGSLIDNSDGTVTYKPNENSQGSDSFSYTISDNEGEESNSATVMIDVEAVNDTPVVKDETLDEEYSEQNRFEIDVLENDSDIDGDTLTIIAASASIGEVIINDDKLTYQAPAGFTGNVELQYLVSDGNGESVQATVTLVINGKAELGIPIITVPDDIEVNATALFTRVDLGVATARDTDGEALPVSLRGSQIFFTPGKNIAYWRTEDAQGNTAEASQKVTVYPLVTIAKDSETTEGTRHSVKVYLNGQSPIYPVDIPYSVSGSANQYDHDLRDGKVTIEHGTVGKIEFNIFQDAENESDEALTITLDPSLNLGSKTEYTLRISEKNIAPKVTTSIVQQAEVRQIIVNNNEPVTISTEVTDANVDDSHQYIWSSDEPLIVNTSQVPEQFIFTPAQLNPGIYHFKLTVKDDGSEPLFVSKDIYLEVIEALASLGSEDTDGDLIPDNEEGFSDNDNDGIPDYQDAISECNVIQEQVSESVRYLVEGEAGVCLRKGITVASNITGGTHLLDNEVSEQLEVDQEADNIGGVFDFVAYGLPQAGQSYKVVFPQRLPIPVNAVYRKYIDGTGWRDFVIDDYNELSSTPGERGYCPPPGDESWVIGLNQGHWCVQLRIEDGGPNDDDGIANGSVVDPGGVAARVSKNTLPVAQNDAISMSLNSNITIDVLANDSDADGNVLDIANAVADFGTVDIINNQLYYTAEDHFYGVATISYSITDNSGGTSFADVTVNVVNSLSPVATDDQAQADDKTALLINVLANDSDPDGDSLTVIAAEAQNGQVIINTDQTLTYMPKEGFEGVDTITYRIRDLNGLEDTAVVRVQVSLKRSVVVENKSGGGIGGGMLLLTLLGLTRHYRWKRWLGLLLLLSFNSQANWFVESDLGLSKAHERSAVKADTVIDSDDSDFYWTVGIGYSINPRWSVAARYIDQGQGSATISNSTASPDEYHQSVALVVPVLASGVGVDVSYSAWQADAFNFAVSVGGMYWKADFDSVYQGNSLHYSDEGVDPYLGVELGYDINSQWTVGLGVTRYLIEANDVDAFSLKLKYRMDIEKN